MAESTDLSWLWDLYSGSIHEKEKMMCGTGPYYLISSLKKGRYELRVGFPLPFFPPENLSEIIQKDCLSVERLGEIIYGPYEDSSYDPNLNFNQYEHMKTIGYKWIKENGDYEHRYSVWRVAPQILNKWDVKHISSWDIQRLPGHPDCMIMYNMFLPADYTVYSETYTK